MEVHLFSTGESLVIVVAVMAATLLVLFGLRRYSLRRGTVPCSVRTVPLSHDEETGEGVKPPHGPWRRGCVRYGSEELRWFRTFSLRPLPAVRLPRRGLVVLGRREPEAQEFRNRSHMVVVEVGSAHNHDEDSSVPTHELAMSEPALTGFLSWVEAVPPGPRYLS